MNCDINSEELAAYTAGDLVEPRAAELRAHIEACASCREQFEALNTADQLLREFVPEQPPADAMLATRRAVSEQTRKVPEPEIMTLDEVAEYLKLSAEELDEIVPELPAFELAGRIRVRRAKLKEWIDEREHAYRRQAVDSWTTTAKESYDQGVA